MNEKDSGPAFPQHEAEGDGMSLRDYFAGQVVANSELVTGDWGVGNERDLARVAYSIADCMLKERAKC